jgi:hypothetical protein
LLVLADKREGGLYLGQGAHVLQELVGAEQVAANGDQGGIAAFGGAVDVEANVDNLIGGHAAGSPTNGRFFDNPVGQDVLYVVLGSFHAKREMGRLVARAADVLGFDGADCTFALAGVEEAQEGFAVPVGAAHDLLLQLAPVGAFQEAVDDALGLARQLPIG